MLSGVLGGMIGKIIATVLAAVWKAGGAVSSFGGFDYTSFVRGAGAFGN